MIGLAAFGVALVGALIVWIGFACAQSVAARLGALVAGFLSMPALQLLGGAHPDVASRAGAYWVYMLLLFYVLSRMFSSPTR